MHYSGHGSQVKDLDGDEKDNLDTPGMDDCICPCDFDNYEGSNGFITDDVLKEILVNQIPVGARLRAFFDCCHSGSILDLEYMWKKDEEFLKTGAPEKRSHDIIMVSGCKDSQTSADSWNDQKKEAMGALTMMLIKALITTKTIKTTWNDFLLVVRHHLAAEKYEQMPMLSVSEKNLIHTLVEL